MRELKFRLMRNEKVVGYERHIPNEVSGKFEIQHSIGGNSFWYNVIEDIDCFIQHDAKHQYTGLENLKMHEIYEKDVVEYSGEDWRVEYSAGSFVIVVGNIEKTLDYEEVYENLEITGKIYKEN